MRTTRFLFPIFAVSVILLGTFVLFSGTALGAERTVTRIVPECNVAGVGDTSIEGFCDENDLAELVGNVFNFIFLVIIPAGSMILFALAGFMIMLGQPSTVANGKDIFKTTVIGIVILYTSFMITNFILNIISLGNPDVQNWQEQLEKEGVSAGVGTSRPTLQPGTLSQGDAREKFVTNGVIVKSGAGLDGIRDDTVDEVIRLKQECGCQVVVTEGTGGTHATGTYSHENGYKIDVRSKDPATGERNDVSKYVFSNPEKFQFVRNRSDGTPVYRRSDNHDIEYAFEGAGTPSEHWDILVRN